MSLFDQQLGFRNPILEAYIQGTELRRARQKQAFQQNLQTEEAKRREQERQDAVRHWEDQLKFQRERLAFDREKETADNKYRALQGKKLELDMKDLGFKMLAEGRMQGSIIPKSWEDVKPGLDELYNTSVGSRPGTQALLAGAGLSEDTLAKAPSTSVTPYTKGDVDVGAGVILKGSEYVTPYEYGQSELARKAPLKSLEEQIALRKLQQQEKARLEITNLLEQGRNQRAQDAESGRNLRAENKEEGLERRLGITGQQRLDLAKYNADAAMERLKYKQSAEGKRLPKGGVKAQEKAATWQRISEQYDDLIKLGDKIGWSAQSPMGLLPGGIYSKLKASFPGSDTPDMIGFRSGIGRVTAEELHKLYGSVLSLGELARAAGFIADISNDPTVAKDRLEKARDAARREYELLSEVGGSSAESSSGSSGAKKSEVPSSTAPDWLKKHLPK